MHWDDTSQAGFSEGIPWLPVNPNYVNINAAAALADPNSVFRHFQKLIKLRHDHPVIVEGRFELLLPDHEQIWALTRTLDDQLLLMVANCSSSAGDDPGRLRCRTSAAPRCCWPPIRARAPATCGPGSRGSTCVAEAAGPEPVGASVGGVVSLSAGASAARARIRNGSASAEPMADQQVGDPVAADVGALPRAGCATMPPALLISESKDKIVARCWDGIIAFR